MSRFVSFLVLMLMVAIQLQGQITITNAAFLSAGDSFYTASALNFDAISPGESGIDKTWDFTALQATGEILTVVKPANQGSKPASFPNTDLVFLNDGGEAYYQVTANAMINHGFIGNGGFPLSDNVEPKYLPPLVEQRAPMMYFDVNTAESALAFTFSADLLPDTLLAQFPFQPDSIRFSQTLSRLDVVDASGTLKMPNADYTVLRERRRTISDTKIEVKILFTWIDLSTIFPLPGLGADTTLAYYYFSNQAKGPLAVVEVNPDTTDQVLGVQFRGDGTSSIYQPIALASPLFKGPVPTVGMLQFDLTILDQPVALELFSSTGQGVFSQRGMQGQPIVDVSHLPIGTYFYRISDARAILETGSLIIQR